jgi:hypothetical protein
MTRETPSTEATEPTEIAATEAAGAGAPRRRVLRGRRIAAVVVGVAMVPALYAVASAVTGGAERPSASVAAQSADDPAGTGSEVEHSVTTVEPDDTAAPAPTSTTLPGSDDDATPPSTTVPEPGEDSPAVPAPAEPLTQTFTSTGGSIEVTLADGALSLGPVTPAAGFTVEVHDAEADRVEVRFFDAQGNEWRIRVEAAGGAMTQEITFHG